jgi:hypothetical protein
MILNLTAFRLRREWLLQFSLDATNNLCVVFSENKLRGAETMRDNANLQFEGTMIKVCAAIFSAGVHPESFQDELSF